MRQCWDLDPNRRPNFKQLIDTFETMIKSEIEYVEVASLIVTNKTYFGGEVAPSVSTWIPESELN